MSEVQQMEFGSFLNKEPNINVSQKGSKRKQCLSIILLTVLLLISTIHFLKMIFEKVETENLNKFLSKILNSSLVMK